MTQVFVDGRMACYGLHHACERSVRIDPSFRFGQLTIIIPAIPLLRNKDGNPKVRFSTSKIGNISLNFILLYQISANKSPRACETDVLGTSILAIVA